MKKLKKLFLILVLVIFLLVLTGCGDEKSKTSKNDTNTTNTDTKNSEESGDNMSDSKKFTEELKNVESSKIVENAQAQMAQPEKGDNIAVLNVEGYGQIKIKFFEDVAPKACENFITHAKEGYYNGLTFHRVMNEFMIQGGDPAGNGTGGESIWGDGFAEELSTNILPYRGALCMASAGVGTNSLGSQFFIVQANYRQDMEAYLSQYGYDNLLEAYKQFSGDLFDLVIYGQYTTFGQVIEGMDVVDKIASVETDPSNDKPVEDVIITSVEIVSY